MTFGQRMKLRRKELNISIDDLAKKLNKNRATVYRYERDEIPNISSEKIVKIANALNCLPEWLLGWTDLKNFEALSENLRDVKIPFSGFIKDFSAKEKKELADEIFKEYQTGDYSDYLATFKASLKERNQTENERKIKHRTTEMYNCLSPEYRKKADDYIRMLLSFQNNADKNLKKGGNNQSNSSLLDTFTGDEKKLLQNYSNYINPQISDEEYFGFAKEETDE